MRYLRSPLLAHHLLDTMQVQPGDRVETSLCPLLHPAVRPYSLSLPFGDTFPFSCLCHVVSLTLVIQPHRAWHIVNVWSHSVECQVHKWQLAKCSRPVVLNRPNAATL